MLIHRETNPSFHPSAQTPLNTDHLTGRPQYVRLGNCRSDTLVSSTAASEGAVLSPVLSTSDFQYNSESCHVQRFADNAAMVGCRRNGPEEDHRKLIQDFVAWCDLNTSKTRCSPLLCSDVLRWQHKEEGRLTSGQAGEEGGLCFGAELEGLTTVEERWALSRLPSIMDNPLHPLFTIISGRGAASETGCCHCPAPQTDRGGRSYPMSWASLIPPWTVLYTTHWT